MKKAFFVFFVAALVAIYLSFLNTNFNNLVSAKFYQLINYFSNGVSSSFKVIFSIRNIYEDNEKLKQELRKLTIENIKLKELEDENKKLRAALNFDFDNKYNKIAAMVVGKAPFVSDDILIINKGSKEGIIKDAIVINYSGELVGSITRVDKDFSEVRLLTDRSFSMVVKVQNADINGVLKGVFGSLIMDLILPDKKINPGDIVLVAGPGKNLFGEIPVGTIEKVISSSAESIQKAKIKPFVDLANIDYVFVLVSKNNF